MQAHQKDDYDKNNGLSLAEKEATLAEGCRNDLFQEEEVDNSSETRQTETLVVGSQLIFTQRGEYIKRKESRLNSVAIAMGSVFVLVCLYAVLLVI